MKWEITAWHMAGTLMYIIFVVVLATSIYTREKQSQFAYHKIQLFRGNDIL